MGSTVTVKVPAIAPSDSRIAVPVADQSPTSSASPKLPSAPTTTTSSVDSSGQIVGGRSSPAHVARERESPVARLMMKSPKGRCGNVHGDEGSDDRSAIRCHNEAVDSSDLYPPQPRAVREINGADEVLVHHERGFVRKADDVRSLRQVDATRRVVSDEHVQAHVVERAEQVGNDSPS